MKKFQDLKYHSYAIRAEIFPSPQTHQDQISGKNKMKFKTLSPKNHYNPFATSFKANFMSIHA